MSNYFFIKEFVDSKFSSGVGIDHEAIAKEFKNVLSEKFDNDTFIDLLIYSGYIPDLYDNDSSEETLFTKLVEVLVAEWADRMGFSSKIIKQKSSKEDICITINDKRIVCDAKSFRLGRSQKAPNVKDFLKLEDIRKWMNNYKNAIGGLVTYPCTHEWSDNSDVYSYCSTKDAPTVMLPYKYLSFALKYKNRFKSEGFLKLWDYSKIFPSKLEKNMPGGNKKAYWEAMNKSFISVTKTTTNEFNEFMETANQKIIECVKANLALLICKKNKTIEKIEHEISQETNIDKLKKLILDYKIANETGELDKLIERINLFRLPQKD